MTSSRRHRPQPNTDNLRSGTKTMVKRQSPPEDDPEAPGSPTQPVKVTSTTERVASGLETAPLVFIGVGGSLAVVGSVPLVVTLSLGVNSSATIIGVGFVGFGFLIIVPGLCWCIVSNALAQCHRHGLLLSGNRRHHRHRHACRTLSTEQEVELLVLRWVHARGRAFPLSYSCHQGSVEFFLSPRKKFVTLENWLSFENE